MNKENIKSYFDAYPKEKTLYVTSDGQVFLTANKNDGAVHQGNINFQSGSDHVVQPVTRETLSGKAAPKNEAPSTDEAPDDKWTVKQIKAWLDEQGIDRSGANTKKKLLALVPDLEEGLEEGSEEETENPES